MCDSFEKKLENPEIKGININDFMLSYNFDYSYFHHDKVPNEDENDIKVLRAEISILIVACKDQ